MATPSMMLALRIASTEVKKSSLETILKLSSAEEFPPLMFGVSRKTRRRPVARYSARVLKVFSKASVRKTSIERMTHQ